MAITIIARLFIGWLCDRIGPRLSYTWLLLFGSIPVMGIGLANNYETFLLFRLGIGVIGASFVITQHHTSVMFAPNVVGTANVTSAGWGNLGGGVTQMVMPLVFAAFIAFGFSQFWGWRLSMVVAGGVCFATGLLYYTLTTDLPDGNFKELRARGEHPEAHHVKGSFLMACKDSRSWALFVIYVACAARSSTGRLPACAAGSHATSRSTPSSFGWRGSSSQSFLVPSSLESSPTWSPG